MRRVCGSLWGAPRPKQRLVVRRAVRGRTRAVPEENIFRPLVQLTKTITVNYVGVLTLVESFRSISRILPAVTTKLRRQNYYLLGFLKSGKDRPTSGKS